MSISENSRPTPPHAHLITHSLTFDIAAVLTVGAVAGTTLAVVALAIAAACALAALATAALVATALASAIIGKQQLEALLMKAATCHRQTPATSFLCKQRCW